MQNTQHSNNFHKYRTLISDTHPRSTIRGPAVFDCDILPHPRAGRPSRNRGSRGNEDPVGEECWLEAEVSHGGVVEAGSEREAEAWQRVLESVEVLDSGKETTLG